MNWKVFVTLLVWALVGSLRFVRMGVDGLCSFPFASTSILAVLSLILYFCDSDYWKGVFTLFIIIAILSYGGFEAEWAKS